MEGRKLLWTKAKSPLTELNALLVPSMRFVVADIGVCPVALFFSEGILLNDLAHDIEPESSHYKFF